MDNTREGLDVENPTEKTNGLVGGVSKSVTKVDEESKSSSSSKWSVKEICNPKGQFLPIWNKIFVISCMFAVSLDPLFFYILIIDQEKKCLQMDKKLSFVALLLRSLTDIIFLVHFIFEIYDSVTTIRTSSKKLVITTLVARETTRKMGSFLRQQSGENSSKKPKPRSLLTEVAKGISHKMSWLSISIVIDFVALLPIPQMLIVVTHMSGFGYFEHKQVLNIFLLGQYLPSCIESIIRANNLKALLDFGLEVYSIFLSTFLLVINFGTNLTTSTYVWENLFAILISIIGLLLFLYLIGQVQTFMQMETTKSEEVSIGFSSYYARGGRRASSDERLQNRCSSSLLLQLAAYIPTVRRKIKTKKLDVHKWISTNGIPDDMKKEIMKSIEQKHKENKDSDIYPQSFLHPSLENKKISKASSLL